MKVQTKILVLLLGIGAIFVAGLVLIKWREQAQFRRITDERTRERKSSFAESLERFSERVKKLTQDCTSWDLMAKAVSTATPQEGRAWIEGQFDNETWSRSDASAIWIYKLDRTLFYGADRPYAYGDLHETVSFPKGVFDILDRERYSSFFISTPKGLMQVHAGTIHFVSGSGQQNVPKGYFFAGRIWNAQQFEELGIESNNIVEPDIVEGSDLAQDADTAIHKGMVKFSCPLPGWDGQPVARVTVSNNSAYIRDLNVSSQQLLYWLILFSLVFIILLSVSLNLWVKEPLAMISAALRMENTAPLEKLRDSKSEFADLAKLIREFFEQRTSLIAEINERKNAQEALRISGEQLRQSQKMEAVGRLAGGVAHDFNNLLTAILGYAELLANRKELDPSSRQNVEMIQKAGRQAAAVTHQLLAFSRKQILQPRVIDLNALITDFEKILRRVIGEHIDLKTRTRAARGKVRADPNQLEQVILNLGVNARDAMLPRGGRITIRTANVTLDAKTAAQQAPDLAAGRYVMLEFSDTGHGMSDEVRSRIFEPFFTTKGPGKGTGLGLATVYGITKQSGGAIAVESAPGAGCTFRVYLPEEDGELEELRPKTIVPIAMPVRQAETVLVVEDEEIVRDLVCHVLSEQGYNVLCAPNGVEALELSSRHKGEIRLLITDVVMPLIGGLELARKMLDVRPFIKVLYVSGYSENDMSEQGIAAGELEFLEKPFTPQSLSRKVHDVLESSGGDSTVPPGRPMPAGVAMHHPTENSAGI